MTEQPLTFDPCFKKLGREIERFANHTRKLLRASQRHREKLIAASAWSEGAAPLDAAPESPARAMRAIDKFARVHRENRTALFGAYFAHHYLRTQAETARDLLRESFNTDPGHRVLTCHRIYVEAERTRRDWIAALLDLSIAAAAPDLSKRDYVAFNVGALTDHEDVDLAIVVRSIEARDALARGFSLVAKTFLRYASKVQLFLTEQFSTPRTGALLDEYAELLERPTRSVVSVMQLLGSQFLCGDKALARSLDDRVIINYYAGQGRPIAHEGFLRSVMHELRYYLSPPMVPGVLAPKREIYVPTKLATSAMRVIHGVHDPLPCHALAKMAEVDVEHAKTYTQLADAFVQNEILRTLMSLYVFQADEFDLSDDDIRTASHRVALLLGLGASARRSAEDRLMGAYTEIRGRALDCVAKLQEQIDTHLMRVSTFRQIVEKDRALTAGSEENFVLGLLSALENYKGSVFWDEVVELIAQSRRTAERFTDDFGRIPIAHRAKVAQRYVDMMAEDAAALIEFLVYVAQRDQEERIEGDAATATWMWSAMMAHLESSEVALERLTQRLDTEATADALYRLAVAYSPRQIAKLADTIEAADTSTRGARVVRALRSVIVLAYHRSNAVGRISTRVLARAPDFLTRLGDARRLKDLASEINQQAAHERRPQQQIELLGDAFDVAVLRAALIAILEGAPAARDEEFTGAVDIYVRELFKACFREVRQRSPMFQHYRPGSRIAVYATGGYGRGEAFGGDWDYLAVVDRDDRGLKKFFGKVLQRVSGAMTRRGLHPHNRFTEHFNAYVVSIPELVDYFKNRSSETFIDEAEILEARFFLGDPVVARGYNEEVRDLVSKHNGAAFVRDILDELEDRRTSLPQTLNLKLGAGGLREIHLLWLAIRIIADLPGPLVPELLGMAADLLPECRSDLRFLMLANADLRRARDLYRLVVAFDDSMVPEEIVEIAKDLAPLRLAGVRGDYAQELERLLQASAQRIDRVAHEIRRRMR